MSESSRWQRTWSDCLMTADFVFADCPFSEWVIILLQMLMCHYHLKKRTFSYPIISLPLASLLRSLLGWGVLPGFTFCFSMFLQEFPLSSVAEGHSRIFWDSHGSFVRVSGLLQRNCPGLTVPRFVPKCLSLKGKKPEKPLPWTPVCPSVCKVFVSRDGSFLEDCSYHFNLLCRPLI